MNTGKKIIINLQISLFIINLIAKKLIVVKPKILDCKF